MLRKPANALQRSFLAGDITFLVGFEFEKGYDIQQALDYVSKTVIPLNLRFRDDHFEQRRNPLNIRRIPTFGTVREAADYVDVNMRPNVAEEIAIVAHNDHQLVLNINHGNCDGTYVKFLTGKFGELPTNQIPRFNEDDFEIFADQIAAAKEVNFFNDPTMMRTIQQLPPVAKKPRVSHEISIIPAHKFKLYDEAKNSPRKFTESLWIATYFATCMNRRRLITGMNSFPTVCETRKWLPHAPGFENGNHDSVVTPGTELHKNMTLSELGKRLRDDMNLRFDRKDQFCYLKALITPPAQTDAAPITGNIWSHSSIGPITFKRPIVDMWVNTSGLAGGFGSLSLLAYSLNQPEKNRNDVILNLQYDENVWNQKEAQRMNAYFEHIMQYVSHDRQIADVYDEMRHLFPDL